MMAQNKNKQELKEKLQQLSLFIQNEKYVEINYSNYLDLNQVRAYLIGQYFNYEASQTKKLEEIYNQFQLSSYFSYDAELLKELVIANRGLEGSGKLNSIRKYQTRGILLFIIFLGFFCGSLFSYYCFGESQMLSGMMFASGLPCIMLSIPTFFSLYERKITKSFVVDINKKWDQLYKEIGGEIILEYQKNFNHLLDLIIELQKIENLDFLMPIYKEEVLTKNFSIMQTSLIKNDKPKSLRKLKEKE